MLTSKGVALFFVVLVLTGFSTALVYTFVTDERFIFSGFDTAEITAACGGATPCTCGDTLTSSRTMDGSDTLVSCPTSSNDIILSLGAPNITLDCAGNTISGNGSSGIVISTIGATPRVEGVTIRNCILGNTTQIIIRLTQGSGNHSVIENNKINTSFGQGIFLFRQIENITIRGNTFSGNVTSPVGVGVTLRGAMYSLVTNNTFLSLDKGVIIGGSSFLTANNTVTLNNYTGSVYSISIEDGPPFLNNTIRDENLSGTTAAITLTANSTENRFINISTDFVDIKRISFDESNATFVHSENASSNLFLAVSVNRSSTFLKRGIDRWTTLNITVRDHYSASVLTNYTVISSFGVGGAIFKIEGVTNQSRAFNADGDASFVTQAKGTVANNYSFIVDVNLPTNSFISPTFPNNTLASQSFIPTNVSVSDGNLANISFFLRNSTGGVINRTDFLTVNPDGTRGVFFESLTDGTYLYEVRATDLVNQVNTTPQRTIRLDTTAPTLTYVSPTPNNASIRAGSELTINVSITEAHQQNMTFVLKFNNGSIVNITTKSPDVTNNSITFVVPSDGIYLYYVNATDQLNKRNSTETRKITLDATAPSVSVGASPNSISAGDSVTLSCSASDTRDPSPSASLSVKQPGETSFSSASSPYTDTTKAGTYTVRCTGTDDVSNSASSETTFTVTAVSSEGSSGGGGGAEGDECDEDAHCDEGYTCQSNTCTATTAAAAAPSLAPEAVPIEAVPTGAAQVPPVPPVTNLETVTSWVEEGVYQDTSAEPGETYTFNYWTPEHVPEAHNVIVSAIRDAEREVEFTVSSTPQQVRVIVGASEDVDLNADDTEDLRITVNGIQKGSADVTFEKLSAWRFNEGVARALQRSPAFAALFPYRWFVGGILILFIVALILAVLVFVTPKKPKPFEGRKAATLQEYYQFFRSIAVTYETSTNEQKAQFHTYIKDLRATLAKSWLASGTSLTYVENTLDAYVYQGASKTDRVEVPVLSGEQLLKHTDDKNVLGLLQAIFATRDDFNTIISVLEFVSGVPRSNIVLWSPDRAGRVSYKQRVVGLDFDKGTLRISCSGLTQQ